MKILIVDDSTAMRKIIRTILKNFDYGVVEEAQDGLSALDKIKQGGIDLVITDWGMPRMSGLELVATLRYTPETAKLPVILTCSSTDQGEIGAAMRIGANDYISKPFNPLQLKAKVDKVMGLKSPPKPPPPPPSNRVGPVPDGAAPVAMQSDTGSDQIGPVLNGAATVAVQDDFPFVAFAEKHTDAINLGRSENKGIVDYLVAAVQALEEANRQVPDADVDYVLENSTHDVMRLVRFHRDHLKMLTIASDIPGGGLTLSRLAALNQEAGYKVCLLCYQQSEFSAAQRDSMEKLGILLLERRQLSAEVLQDLFREYVLAATHEASEEPHTLSPEELQERLETDISLTTELPVLPQVYNRVMKLARDPNSTMAEWAEAVETDPLSAAMVIRRARSPVYGFRDKVEDVMRAVTLLGKEAVKELVASAALKSSLKAVADASFNIEDFWRHSAATGLAARMLVLPFDGTDWDNDQRRYHDEWEPSEEAVARLKELDLAHRFDLSEAEDAFVGGMMHDIGKVALVCAYPGLFPMILEGLEAADYKIPMRGAEEQLTASADHSHVGSILANNWELGPELSRVVERHHRPASGDNYAHLVCLADFIAGAVFPFPRSAAFPHATQVVRQIGAPDPIFELSDAERGALEEEFLPPTLLERFDMDVEEVLELAALLGPGLQQLSNNLLRSLGTDE